LSWILDTNVVSELARKKPNPRVMEWLGDHPLGQCYISAITLGEIQQGISKTRDASYATQLQNWLELDILPMLSGRILPIDEAVALQWGRWMGEFMKRGRPLPALDAMLAATAIVHDLTLVTRNMEDLETLPVKLHNPWE